MFVLKVRHEAFDFPGLPDYFQKKYFDDCQRHSLHHKSHLKMWTFPPSMIILLFLSPTVLVDIQTKKF